MLPGPITFSGDAIADETQLDGKRHLTLQLVDSLEIWLATVHLILDLEGGRHEAELELARGAEAVWSGALDGEAQVEADTEAGGGLRCEAVFHGEDGERVFLSVIESDAGYFDAVCAPGSPPNAAP